MMRSAFTRITTNLHPCRHTLQSWGESDTLRRRRRRRRMNQHKFVFVVVVVVIAHCTPMHFRTLCARLLLLPLRRYNV